MAEIIVKPPNADQIVATPNSAATNVGAQITPTPALPGVPSIFSRLGFVPAGSQAVGKKRLFITSEGETGGGKTRFLWTMPGPIAVVDFDRGTEGVLDVVRNSDGLPVNMYGHPILRKPFEFAEFDEGGRTMTVNEWAEAKRSYEMLKKVIEDLVRSNEVRTLAVDTGTAAYALAQAARFGQLARVGEVPPQMWTSMQAEFENIFLRAYDYGCNVYITHRQGSKFKGLSGEKELKGYKLIKSLAQVHLDFRKQLMRVPDPSSPVAGATIDQARLSIKVIKCRQRWSLDGHEFPVVMLGEDQNGMMQSIGGRFVDVAMAVFPQSREEDWV